MHVALAVILLIQGAAAEPPKSIFGAYEDCPFWCRTIQIRPDGTFIHRLDGDLYNDERIVGRWTWLGEGKLRAQSPIDASPPMVREDSRPGQSLFTIAVLDEPGAVLPGVTLTPLTPDPGTRIQTDSKGVATLPACNEFEVAYLGYRGRYRPQHHDSNAFELTLSDRQLLSGAIDHVWLVQDGRLHIADAAGVFDMTSGLSRISRTREKAIFSTAAPN